MTAAPLHFAGERLMLDPAGALVWPEAGCSAVSDLHLEKGSSFARRGMLLPPWDTAPRSTASPLLLRRWPPRSWWRSATGSTTAHGVGPAAAAEPRGCRR